MTTAAAPLAPPSARARALGPRGEGLTVVSEQIAEFGGVERIVATIVARYPAASMVTTRFEPGAGFDGGEFEARVAELADGSANGRAPEEGVRLVGRGGRRRRHFLFPLYARALRSSAPEPARTVLSIGGMGWSSAVRVPAGARHVAYTGGPPRPLYGHTGEYLREYPPLVRPLVRAALPALRSHHRRLLAAPELLAANSRYSARGMERITGRPVTVIYPPVRTEFFTPAERLRRHFLVVSRLRPHKRIDVVIEAFRRTREPLVIAGEGPWRERLERSAPPNVAFVGHVGDEELRELYRTSRALISASVEEFGLCLAEALACGTPVVAPRAGGSGEIVADDLNGVGRDSVDPDSIVRAVERLDAAPPDPADCRRSAERFSVERFEAELAELIDA